MNLKRRLIPCEHRINTKDFVPYWIGREDITGYRCEEKKETIEKKDCLKCGEYKSRRIRDILRKEYNHIKRFLDGLMV